MLSSYIRVLFLYFLTISFAVAQKPESDFTFAFITDIHIKHDPAVLTSFRKVVTQVNAAKPDFILSGGDQVYDVMRGGEKHADSLFQLFKTESSKFHAPIYTTVGNHELFGIYPESKTGAEHPYYRYGAYEKYLGKPYYSFDHKGWHFVVLNNLDTLGKKYISSIDPAQLEWLQQDLQKISTTTPVVVMMHVPIVSVQNQVDMPAVGESTDPDVVGKRELLAILAPYNLKAVLQGHLHFFEDILVHGKTHFITGGAVAGRPSWRGTRNGPRGFLLFRVKGDQFSYSFVDYENNRQTQFR